MSKDTVDILLATYNGARYLSEQIESICNQSYNDWRLLISDDCSSDDTVSIASIYAERDERISVVERIDACGAACGHFLNLLMTDSSSHYFAFSDQDDFWIENKLAKSLTALKEMERIHGSKCPLMVFSDLAVVDADLNVLDPSYLHYSRKEKSGYELQQLLMTNVVAGCTIVGNAALRDLITERLEQRAFDSFLMHDWLIALVAQSCGYIKMLPDSTVLYRQHGENVVGAEGRSLSSFISRLSKCIKKEWMCFEQAESIYGLFEDRMRPEQKELFNSFVQVKKVSKIKRASLLRHAGIKKRNKLKNFVFIIIASTTNP